MQKFAAFLKFTNKPSQQAKKSSASNFAICNNLRYFATNSGTRNVEKKFGSNYSILAHREKVKEIPCSLQPFSTYLKEILVPATYQITLPSQIYRPREYKDEYPTLFYLPGTAFIATEHVFSHMICSHLAEYSKCQVIKINSRLAPENPFPTGVNDAYAGIKFILTQLKKELEIDKDRIGLVGYSSGANFAPSICLKAKAEGLAFQRQVLISPMLDLSRSQQLHSDFEDKDETISDEFVKWFLSLYIPPNINPRNPLLSPFWHNATNLATLPPTDIFFAEFDRFRSDSEAFYRKLKLAGISVNKTIIVNQDHSFLWHNLEDIKFISRHIGSAFIEDLYKGALSYSV